MYTCLGHGDASNQQSLRDVGGQTVSEEIPEGYYRDHQGDLQRDRRKKVDRRANRPANMDGDRRNMLRRHTDEAIMEREHHQMIEDALEEFAADH